MSGGTATPPLLDRLDDRAAQLGAAPAIVAARVSLSFCAVGRELDRRAAALRGVEGAVVAVATSRPVEALLGALAVRRAGGIPFVLRPGDRVPALAAFTLDGDAGGGPVPRRAESGPPAGTAYLRATGGTTGTPRLVAFDEAGAAAAADTPGRQLQLERGVVLAITAAPWSGYGWNNWCAALLRGACVRHVSPLAPRELLAAVRGRPAVGFTTPEVVRALARLPPGEGAGGARLIVGAAAYPLAEALEAQRRHGVVPLECYGATEAGPIGYATAPGGSLCPAPGTVVRAEGDPPVLVVASPSVAVGYAGGPLFGGVFRTADRVELLSDGSFRLRGRADRVRKRMSQLVDLDGVERVLASLPGVARARVRVVPGALDIDLVAQLVPAGGAAIAPEAALAALTARLAPWERPSRVELVAPEHAVDAEKWRAADELPEGVVEGA